MKRKVLTLSEKVIFWQAWTKAQALTNGVSLSREEIQTWNQDIGSANIDSEVEDDDQEQCIVTTTKISTIEASVKLLLGVKIIYLI